MDVMPGYKQSEVGVIPEDWEVAELSSVSSLVTGNTPPTSDKRNYGDQYPFVSPSDLGEHKWISTSEKRISARGRLFSRVVPKSAILFVCIGSTIGKTGIAAVDLSTNQQITCATIGDKHCPDFIYYALDFIAPRISFFAGQQAVPIVNKTEFGKSPIGIPPTKAEQEAIAEALSDADALIESLEQLIAKKRDIKQATMQELLRPKDGWVNKKLGNLGAFLKGSGVRKDEAMSGELPCIRYGEIYTKHSDYIKGFHSWISKEVAATARRLRAGDLLFAGSGETSEEIGKCVAFVDDFEAYAGGDIVILRLENASAVFMGYYLNTGPINRQKASKGQGDAVVHIGASALAGIDITIPGFDEQTAIATILSDMDAEIAALETKLAKIRRIKQGMMHNLLTGRIRLV